MFPAVSLPLGLALGAFLSLKIRHYHQGSDRGNGFISLKPSSTEKSCHFTWSESSWLELLTEACFCSTPAFPTLNFYFPPSLPVAILWGGGGGVFSSEVLPSVLRGRSLPEPAPKTLGLGCVLQPSHSPKQAQCLALVSCPWNTGLCFSVLGRLFWNSSLLGWQVCWLSSITATHPHALGSWDSGSSSTAFQFSKLL